MALQGDSNLTQLPTTRAPARCVTAAPSPPRGTSHVHNVHNGLPGSWASGQETLRADPSHAHLLTSTEAANIPVSSHRVQLRRHPTSAPLRRIPNQAFLYSRPPQPNKPIISQKPALCPLPLSFANHRERENRPSRLLLRAPRATARRLAALPYAACVFREGRARGGPLHAGAGTLGIGREKFRALTPPTPALDSRILDTRDWFPAETLRSLEVVPPPFAQREEGASLIGAGSLSARRPALQNWLTVCSRRRRALTLIGRRVEPAI